MTQPTILLIEDEPWLAAAYRKTLETDYTVMEARDAVAAIEAIDARPPDLVLLDMFLPTVNGLQLIHEMRSYQDLAALPVVVISSLAFELSEEQRQAYGIVASLAKSSLTPSGLRRQVREALAS